MTLDVVNEQNETVDALELSDDVFGGRVAASLIWEAVVHEQAARRRGTHATKTRGRVSGSGRKPWRQKGTGRARVGEIRNPLWRTGGTVFGPQPRQYGYRLPHKVALGALRAAVSQKLADNAVTVLTSFSVSEPKTHRVAELLDRLGLAGKVVVVDRQLDAMVQRAAANLPNLQVVPSGRVTARDVIDARHVVLTTAAAEHLVQVLS